MLFSFSCLLVLFVLLLDKQLLSNCHNNTSKRKERAQGDKYVTLSRVPLLLLLLLLLLFKAFPGVVFLMVQGACICWLCAWLVALHTTP